MRYFLAISPPENICKMISSYYDQSLKDTSWTDVHQIHLTLRFLGDIDTQKIELIKKRLKMIQHQSFQIQWDKIGCFYRGKTPQILWLGVIVGAGFVDLKKKIDDILFEFDIPKEKRVFHPHLTLARCKNVNPLDIKRWIEKHRPRKIPPILIKEFDLFTSTLSENAAVHKIEKKFHLIP